MTANNIFTILESTDFPSTEIMKEILGKKFAAKYDSVMQQPIGLSEKFQKLGDHVHEKNQKNFASGFESVSKETICYILAAKATGVNGIKKLDAIATALEDNEFSGSDPRFNQLSEKIRHDNSIAKLKDITPNFISNENLKVAINQAYTLKDETIANRLDAQYEIFKQTSSLLNSTPNASEQNEIQLYHNQAKKFLEFVLDTNSIKKFPELMQMRENQKDANPEYIPGKVPTFAFVSNARQIREKYNLDDPLSNPHLDQASSTKKIRSLFTRVVFNEILKNKQQLLAVNENAKEKDKDENTEFLNAAQRDNFRVIIHNGKIFERAMDNSFNLVDTQHNVSKSGNEYAAFVMNNKGELSLFDHTGGEKAFYHSSLNSQGYAFSAGEIKIVDGHITEITSKSGHYQPKITNVVEFLLYLQNRQVDISNIVVTIATPNLETKQMDEIRYSATELVSKLENAKPLQDSPEISAEFEANFEDDFSREESSSFSNANDWDIAATTESDSDSVTKDNSNFSDFDDDFGAQWPEVTPKSPATAENDDWASFDNQDDEVESFKMKR